jgi:hypothetical protein
MRVLRQGNTPRGYGARSEVLRLPYDKDAEDLFSFNRVLKTRRRLNANSFSSLPQKIDDNEVCGAF